VRPRPTPRPSGQIRLRHPARHPSRSRHRSAFRKLLPLLLAAAGCGPCGYNAIVLDEQEVEASWKQVEGELQRRADVVPSLLEAAKRSGLQLGEAGGTQERGLVAVIAASRAALLAAPSRPERIASSNQLDAALGRLSALLAARPALQADADLARLRDEMARAGERLDRSRDRYNDAVLRYNTRVTGIPGAWWARLGKFPRQKELFRPEPGRAETAGR
jgi:LemA protein